MAIMLGMIALFFVGIIAILYITLKRTRSFDDYAVAGRSFGPWYVAMCYVNSWWPGTVFISFAGISVASGVFGFYGLAYSTLGLSFMYFIATRAWRWGKEIQPRHSTGFDETALHVQARRCGVFHHWRYCDSSLDHPWHAGTSNGVPHRIQR